MRPSAQTLQTGTHAVDILTVQLVVRTSGGWCGAGVLCGMGGVDSPSPRTWTPGAVGEAGEDWCPGRQAWHRWWIGGHRSSPEWPVRYLDLEPAGGYWLQSQISQIPSWRL